jgi:hypothetical protein
MGVDTLLDRSCSNDTEEHASTKQKSVRSMVHAIGKATVTGILFSSLSFTVTGCEWPLMEDDYSSYDRKYPRIKSVLHSPDPAFIDESVHFSVQFYSYGASLSFDTDNDHIYDDSSTATYTSPGDKTIRVRARRDGYVSTRYYSFTVYDTVPQFTDITLDSEPVENGRFIYSPSDTVELQFNATDDGTITTLEGKIDEWDGSSYIAHTPYNTITESETITLPSSAGRYRYTIRAEDDEANTNTIDFIIPAINDPSVNPTGGYQHQKDGSVTYSLDWGDLDLVFGADKWNVQTYVDTVPYNSFSSPNYGITLPLDFVGSLSVAIGKEREPGQYHYTGIFDLGLEALNAAPFPIDGPSNTIMHSVGTSVTETLSVAEVGGKKDPNGDTITYHSDPLPSFMQLDADTGEITITNAQAGNYPIEFWTEDEYGEDTSGSSYQIIFNFM